MIRRISKNNDLKDLIKSCPSGVIDDITEIRYFISGHPETEIVAIFEKVGSHLEAILPTSDLATLGNGVLMRRALYKVSDPAYPDGYYNLEFVDNLDVWLGDEETEDPFDPGYLTPDDLKTINNQSIVGQGNITIEASVPDYYATKSWVSEQGYITSEELPEDIATKSWVSSNFLSTTALSGYATEQYVYDTAVSFWDSAVPQLYESYVARSNMSSYLSGYATESWVSSQQFATESWVQAQGYITSTGVSGLATMSWVEAQGYITSTGLSGLATQSWVLDQGYITSETLPEDIATQSWVSSNFLSTTALTGYATESWVSSNYVSTTTLSSYTTFTDIDSYISSFWYRAAEEFYSDYVPRSEVGSYLTGYATESWVSSQQFITSAALTGYATESWVQSQGYLTSVPSEYATESWVEAQGYLTSHQNLSSYATKSWVSSQQFATESWVSSQGYLTSVPNGYALSSWVNEYYAQKTWVSNNFVNETEVWTGTTAQWNALTSAQKATYKIALITE